MTPVVRMKFGSHLYGTNTPASDLDFKGIFLPSGRDIVLQRVKHTIATKRPKGEGEKNFAGEVDDESYALHRFFQLAAEGQTVSLDMLFAPPAAILARSDCWDVIVGNRSRLLTKKSAAFVGYCRTQANKYGIKGSRVAAAKAAMEMFESAINTHGLQARLSEIAPLLAAFVTQHEHSALVELSAVGRGAEDMLLHFECCNKKVPYTNSLKSAFELYQRIYTEYGHRARKAETNEGVDWKALSHAVRVGREAIELLETGYITFPLPYASRILEIKSGGLTYDAVAAEIEQLLEDVEAAAARSSLPDVPDMGFVDYMVETYYRNAVTHPE